MKASVVSRAVRTLVLGERQPVFIWGGPGIGKSAVVRQLADDLAIPLQDVRALLLDPVDLRGLPFLDSDGRSKWSTPDFLPQEGEGILFLDELNAAPAMVQASATNWCWIASWASTVCPKAGRLWLPGIATLTGL